MSSRLNVELDIRAYDSLRDANGVARDGIGALCELVVLQRRAVHLGELQCKQALDVDLTEKTQSNRDLTERPLQLALPRYRLEDLLGREHASVDRETTEEGSLLVTTTKCRCHGTGIDGAGSQLGDQ